MNEIYTVKLASIAKEFALEVICAGPDFDGVEVYSANVNRPGLALAGFFGHFDPKRVQVIGNAEHKYLANLSDEKRRESVDAFFAMKPVAVVFSTSLDIFPEAAAAAESACVPVLRTADSSSAFIAALIASLNGSLAPRITRHGVFVEVYGEGCLILGDSGIGKSETAIELVKRGHRLIADDAVEIKKVSAKTLVGSAPEMIRHYVEMRGIGVVDVRHIFGMGAVKLTEKIDLIINLEPWNDKAVYDRLGLDEMTTSLLDVEITSLVVPVKPGRNLAVIIEVAAMNNRHKKMGYNAARELTDRLDKYFKTQGSV